MSLLGCTYWLTHKRPKFQIVLEGGSVKSTHTAQDIDSSILNSLSIKRQLLRASACACLWSHPVVSGHILYGLFTLACVSISLFANTTEALYFQVLNLKCVKIQT